MTKKLIGHMAADFEPDPAIHNPLEIRDLKNPTVAKTKSKFKQSVEIT